MAENKPPSGGAPSYAAQQSLAALLTNDTVAPLSTVDTLSSLKWLRDLVPNKDSPLIQRTINVETRYLKTSLKLLQNSEALRNRFGEGLGAALSLSSLIRSRHAEKTYDAIIDKGIESAGATFGLETPQARADQLNGLTRASVFVDGAAAAAPGSKRQRT